MFILVIVASCTFSSGFCYQRTEPMPLEACREWAKSYNENKMLLTDFAYCEEKK